MAIYTLYYYNCTILIDKKINYDILIIMIHKFKIDSFRGVMMNNYIKKYIVLLAICTIISTFSVVIVALAEDIPSDHESIVGNIRTSYQRDFEQDARIRDVDTSCRLTRQNDIFC